MIKKIIVFKEKDGRRYFDASTIEDLHAACIKVVKERYKMGWYDTGDAPKTPCLTVKEARRLLSGPILIQVISHILAYEKEKNNYDEARKLWNYARTEVVKASNGKAALRILNERRGNEYEGLELVEIEDSICTYHNCGKDSEACPYCRSERVI